MLLQFAKAGALFIAATAAVFSVFIGAVWFYVDNTLCSTTIYDEIPSPGLSNTLYIFQIDCGTTTGFNRQIAIIPKGQKLNVTERSTVFAAHGTGRISATWQGESKVIIQISENFDVQRKQVKLEDIEILYK